MSLFCFALGTLELKYFAYLSLQPSVYDYVYDVKQHISTKMYFVVCLSKERFVVTFWLVTWGNRGKIARENSKK